MLKQLKQSESEVLRLLVTNGFSLIHDIIIISRWNWGTTFLIVSKFSQSNNSQKSSKCSNLLQHFNSFSKRNITANNQFLVVYFQSTVHSCYFEFHLKLTILTILFSKTKQKVILIILPMVLWWPPTICCEKPIY